jgi:hypothetical protein
MSQARRGYVDPDEQKAQDEGNEPEQEDFIMRGGCTLIVDASTLEVRYCISKDVLSEHRLARRRRSTLDRVPESAGYGEKARKQDDEPFFTLRAGLTGFTQ